MTGSSQQWTRGGLDRKRVPVTICDSITRDTKVPHSPCAVGQGSFQVCPIVSIPGVSKASRCVKVGTCHPVLSQVSTAIQVCPCHLVVSS